MKTSDKKRKFLNSYHKTLSISQSAQIIDVSPRTITRWQKSDDDFKKAMVDIQSDRKQTPVKASPPSPSLSSMKKIFMAQVVAQGKCGTMLDAQLELLSMVWNKCTAIYREVTQEGYTPTYKTMSREGDTRYIPDPREELFIKYAQLAQSCLQASSLNFNSKAFDMREIEEMSENERRNIEYRQTRLSNAES